MSTKHDAIEKQWWDELKSLADQDRVSEFYTRYAEYLESRNVLSPSRRAIHKMALLAAERLAIRPS